MLIVVGGAQDAIAQSICFPIRVGDTAAQMAGRLTGDTVNRHAPWFQIVDQSWRPVSKINYDVIHPGWLVCLANGRPSTAPAGPFDRSAEVAGLGALTFVWVPLLVLGALSVSRFAVSYWRQRRERAHIMRRFGGQFVREFGRPLTQFRGNSPLPRARLRISARRSRLEILVAPADGRSYPNLSDHRSNVEYDVARVMTALGRESFANGRPYAEGHWVVLPFHYKGAVRQEGIR